MIPIVIRLDLPPAIAFAQWRSPIQTAMDLDQLMQVVDAYLKSWSREQLLYLPLGVVLPVRNMQELMARAVDASLAEVHFTGPAEQHRLLREMALTLAFAASRLRYLQALRSRGS